MVNIFNRDMSRQQLLLEIISLQQKFDQVMVQHRFQNWMEMDLTTLQFKCLFFIVQTGIATSSKLSQALGVTPADVTGVIDRLIIQGSVQRQENPDDRRIIFLQATEKGKKIIETLCRNTGEHFSRMLEGLSEEELDHIYLGFSAIVRTIHKRRQILQ